MEITPATFEAVDDYNDAMILTARRLAVIGGHGILPKSDLNVHIIVVEDMVEVRIASLEAVSRSGHFIQIGDDSFSRHCPDASGRECYVVVHPAGSDEQLINGVPLVSPKYSYDFCHIDNIGHDAIPIGKLLLKNDKWAVQELYIPPCLTMSAHPELLAWIHKCSLSLNIILSHLSTLLSNQELVMMRFLAIELENYDGNEMPKHFYLLLKKIVMALGMMKINITDLPALPDEPIFNNDDIMLSLVPLTDYLSRFEAAVTTQKPHREEPLRKPPVVGEIWDAETR